MMDECLQRLGRMARAAGDVARNKTYAQRRAEEAARARDRAAYFKDVVEAEWAAQVRFAHERFKG